MTQIIDYRFTSAEELLSHMAGWDMGFNILSSSQRSEGIQQLITPDIMVGQVDFSARVQQQGAAPPGYLTIALLAGGCPPIQWKGEQVGQNSIIVKPLSGQFDAISPAGFHVYSVSVAIKVLEPLLESQLGKGLQCLLPTEGGLLHLAPGHAQKIRQLIFHTLNVTSDKTKALRAFKQNYLDLIVKLIAERDQTNTQTSLPKRRIVVREAMDIIFEKDQQVSLNDLRTALSVSPRTLEYAFNDIYNTSPKKVIKALQLNRAMRQLLKEDSDNCTVTEIAKKHGFTHAGQFAKDYRALFGERPSETLRSKYSLAPNYFRVY